MVQVEELVQVDTTVGELLERTLLAERGKLDVRDFGFVSLLIMMRTLVNIRVRISIPSP